MQIHPKNVGNVILAIRWGTLGLAFFVLFVLDWPNTGFALVVIGLVFSMALRVKRVQLVFASKLTGLDVDDLDAAKTQKSAP